MPGTLVPPWYQGYHVSGEEMSMVSIVWGISLGCTIFSVSTAVNQSINTWRRCHRITEYIVLIWLEIFASVIIGVISWLFMRGSIAPSFEFFFCLLCMWVVQIQVLLQIIVNRIALLLTNRRRVRKMKWAIVAYVGVINMSVFCIWIPAQLQLSPTFVLINHYWDRTEKVLFLLLDAGLNIYFMWLVRKNLIANGLGKYSILFWTNVLLDFLSMFLDLAIILSMSFKNPFIYVQFHPLAYILKLSIELSLAELIAKVARATSTDRAHSPDGIEGSYELGTGPGGGTKSGAGTKLGGSKRGGTTVTTTATAVAGPGARAGLDDSSDSSDEDLITGRNRYSRHDHLHRNHRRSGPSPLFTSEITTGNDRDGNGGGCGITKMVAVEVRHSEAPAANGGGRASRASHESAVDDQESQRWLRASAEGDLVELGTVRSRP